MPIPFFKKLFHRTVFTTPVRPFAHWILWATVLTVFAFLLWANFAVLEESTVGNATVIPLTHVQTIENMEGGIIKQVLVREGDIVQKDQVLVYLDPLRFVSALREAEAHAAALEIKIARITAEMQNKSFVVSPDLKRRLPSLVKSEEELYISRQDQLKQLKRNDVLAEQELTMTQPLVKEGAASPVEVLHLERQVVDLKNQIDDFHSRALAEAEAAKSELATVQASMVAMKDRLTRTTIRSPVKGIVKQVRLSTTEGVVMPGSEIMSIVPLEDTLLIEAQIKPSDIGFIRPGEQVSVRITAYDSSIYGSLTGTVERVSADTITNQKGQSYYLVRIKTKKNYLRTADDPLYIIPGMTATVSILTDKRTVLNYILSPLIKARENALRER